MCGAIPPLPRSSSWRGAYLLTGHVFMTLYLVKHRDFTLRDKLRVDDKIVLCRPNMPTASNFTHAESCGT